MSSSYREYRHNPPHLFTPGAVYFITGATYKKRGHLESNCCKTRLLESIQTGCRKYNWTLEDWVILDNHYHLMLNASQQPETLSKMMNEIHRFTALWIRKSGLTSTSSGKIFHNYWDSCITFQKSYLARLNYIYFNPVKHGYCNEPSTYQWGSYAGRITKQGDYLHTLKKQNPWDQIDIPDDY